VIVTDLWGQPLRHKQSRLLLPTTRGERLAVSLLYLCWLSKHSLCL
jgi:hypothetical protein